ADGAGRAPVLGRRVRVPRQARRSCEAAVVERRRDEPVCQALGAWPLRLAAGSQRRRASERCATVDAARRYRLAQARSHLAAAVRRIARAAAIETQAIASIQPPMMIALVKLRCADCIELPA